MAVDPNSIVKTHLDALQVGGVDIPLGGKVNLTAVTDPGVSDDSDAGYGIGSVWINTAGDTAWTCVDATPGAAVWFDGGGAGGATLTAGSSGVQGTVVIYPPTADSGTFAIQTTDQLVGAVVSLIMNPQTSNTQNINIPDALGHNNQVYLTSLSALSNGILGAPYIPIAQFRNADGTALAASASSGKFGISQTAGSALRLLGETANSSTVTDVCSAVFTVPENYVAGANILFAVQCNTSGAGTPGTRTLTVAAYVLADDGSMGSNIGPVAANIPITTSAPVGFSIDGSTLAPQQTLLLVFTAVLQETASSALAVHINSVSIVG